MSWGMKARRSMMMAALCLLMFAAMSVVAQEQASGTIHVVQRGETLFRIAQRYGLSTEALAVANGIANPSNILVGQRLIIPLGEVALDAPETYIVQYADTLQGIANVFGTDVVSLIALNNLTNPDSIYVGQTLTIRGTIPPIEEIPDASDEELPAENPPAEIPEQAISDAPQPVASNTIHRIARGETLWRIAQNYGVSLEDLQALNGIEDASRIITGTDLIIPLAEGEAATALPASIARLDLTPQVLVEGKTGRIRITTTGPATVAISFLDREIPVAALPDGTSHLAFASIPLGMAPGIYAMTITVTEATGAVTPLTFNVQVNSGFYGVQSVNLPDSKLELLTPGVEDNERGILDRITAGFTSERYFDGPMGLPAAASMFSAFGARRVYNGQPLERYHTGADFAGAPGTPVLAATAGRVVLADTLNIRGVAVVLDHGWGVYTIYAHMNDRYVSIGDFVQSGQTLGTIGSTGRATGAHLHWEVWVNGRPVDPMQWTLEGFP